MYIYIYIHIWGKRSTVRSQAIPLFIMLLSVYNVG